MPEETDVPSEPGSRRSRRGDPDNESGGGGKVFIIFLVVLLAGAIFALYKRHTNANAQAETDAKSIASFSNQVSELRTKMTLEHSDRSLSQSNQQALLSRRTAELTTASNRLVQTSLLLSSAQNELRSLQENLAAKISTVATLEVQRDELDRQTAAIPVLQHTVADLKEKLAQAKFTQAALEEALGRAHLENADLRRCFDDPTFLRLQAKRAEEAAEVNERVASKQRIKTSDPRVRLELQPDGTVRPLAQTNSQAAK